MHPLNIEFMHMNVCLGYLQDLFFETISNHPDMTVQFRLSLIRSLNKMLCIQNDLISRYYVRDGQEFTETGTTPEHHDDANSKESLQQTPATTEEKRPIGGNPPTREKDEESMMVSIPESTPSDIHYISDSLSAPGSRGNTELRRVRSPSETASTLSTASSIESVQRATVVSAVPISPGMVSPFALHDSTQAFETKIWSGKKNRLGRGRPGY